MLELEKKNGEETHDQLGFRGKFKEVLLKLEEKLTSCFVGG